MILRCGSPLQRSSFAATALAAKRAACSSVCRSLRGSDIHLRMRVRRWVFSGRIVAFRQASVVSVFQQSMTG
jgi:hypothetical protein